MIDNAPEPLKKLAARLTELLDDDHWNEIEPYLLALAADRREGEQEQVTKCPICGNQMLEEIGHESGGPQGWIVDEVGGCPRCLLTKLGDAQAGEQAAPRLQEGINRILGQPVSDGAKVIRIAALAALPSPPRGDETLRAGCLVGTCNHAWHPPGYGIDEASAPAPPSQPTCPHCGVPLTGMNSNPDECLHKLAPDTPREGR